MLHRMSYHAYAVLPSYPLLLRPPYVPRILRSHDNLIFLLVMPQYTDGIVFLSAQVQREDLKERTDRLGAEDNVS